MQKTTFKKCQFQGNNVLTYVERQSRSQCQNLKVKKHLITHDINLGTLGWVRINTFMIALGYLHKNIKNKIVWCNE